MDAVHQRSANPRGGQGDAGAGLVELALWIGRQRDELTTALAALRQAGGLGWASAAGNAYRTALEERRRSLLRAGEAMEAARTALMLLYSYSSAVSSSGGRGPASALRPGGAADGDTGPAIHYEGR
ncbi:hypothetical protein QFZ52_002979 [Arthrobacter woluwensis]|uniref:hypothetical protein n=1 Tax=Arthrobacter woluwensis TaxID=156980 RepID=UPI002784E790|nr:hypothetical protein [Arthrobacter woluwensis]MDQ0710327.1 hypothetical protein [Arthrobacter woluwensis]